MSNGKTRARTAEATLPLLDTAPAAPAAASVKTPERGAKRAATAPPKGAGKAAGDGADAGGGKPARKARAAADTAHEDAAARAAGIADPAAYRAALRENLRVYRQRPVEIYVWRLGNRRLATANAPDEPGAEILFHERLED